MRGMAAVGGFKFSNPIFQRQQPDMRSLEHRLEVASAEGDERSVRACLSAGVNADADEGLALWAARRNGHDRIADMLRRSGARTRTRYECAL